jgi:putative ABC transport system substrate-binding protein
MRLRTIGLISSLALGLLAASLPAEAQKAGKVYRIGILRSGSSSSYLYAPQNKILRQGLRELGYTEGKNLLIQYRYAESKFKRIPDLVAELVRLKVDVLVISPSPATIRAVQGATRTIPIVMMGAAIDVVKAGFVVSLRRPGGNLTGPINPRPELDPKRLELLKEVFPQISRVAILWTRQQQRIAMKKVEAAGQALGIEIQPLVVSNRVGLPSLESALSTISQERPDGLLVPSIRTTLRYRSRIIDFAAKRRLPTIYAASPFLDAGGLMSYDADRQDMLRQVVNYVDKILKGAKPADLPLERPTKFELVINLKTAKQLGFTIPPEVLFRANKVIK